MTAPFPETCDEEQPTPSARLPRSIVERVTLGLAALVLALFGGLSAGPQEQGGRGDRPASRLSAEAPAASHALAVAVRVVEEAKAAQRDGASALPVRTGVLRPALQTASAPAPSDNPAPAGPPRRSPRVPTGPPSILPA